MAGMKLSELDFLRLLPAFMRDDEAAIALCKAVNELVGPPCGRLKTIRTWDQIDRLNEAECDEMAWEQDVDWYDSAGMTLEEKRATIKLAQQIKRKRGTKWAVERLISAYFGEGYVLEWYDLDVEGFTDPYTFLALTTNAAIDQESYEKFVEAVQAAKNERSHIAGVFYFWQQGPDPGVECAMGYAAYQYEFERICGTYPREAVVGALGRFAAETEPETAAHFYGFTEAGEDTCGTYPSSGTIGAALSAAAAAEETLAAFGYTLTRCGTLHCGK